MADHSAIEWTEATWNPLRGCTRVSAGCQHCYAERHAARFSGPGQPYEGLIHPSTRGWNGKVRLVPEALAQPWHWVKPRRIFVNSMSDLFHESVPFEFIAAVFWVMAHTTRHTYQVLTKRPARALEFFRWADDDGLNDSPDDRIVDIDHEVPEIRALYDHWRPATAHHGGYDNCGPVWPYENVWLGVSVENQATADERIPLLLQCPAAVRWLSCEPLLGPVDLNYAFGVPSGAGHGSCAMHLAGITPEGLLPLGKQHLHWVVAGGESGPGARPMHPDWARSLRDQCAAAGVPFFFKQWGDWQVASTANGHFDSVMPDDGSRCTWLGRDGRTSSPSSIGLEEAYAMARVGKRRAGRMLDGVEHNAYPEKPHD